MAITVIDPGEGSIARAFERLGTGLAVGLTEKQRREDELSRNPANMQALAAAYRAASEAGAGPAFLEGIGVRPEFGTKIAAWQPTGNELIEKEFLAQGGPSAVVGAQVGQARVQGAEADAALKFDLPNVAAFAALQEGILKGQTAEEALRQNIPALQSIAQATGFQFDVNNLSYQDELISYRREQGVDKAAINFDKLKTVLGEDMTRQYQNYFESLPEGSHARTAAMMAVGNPGQLQHLQFHEGMNFQREMAELEKKGGEQTLADRVALTLKVRDAWTGSVDNLAKAIKDGEDKDLIATRVADMRSLSFMIQDLTQEDLIEPLDTGVPTAKGQRVRVAPAIFESKLSVDIAEELWNQGIRTKEQLQSAIDSVDPETKKSLRQIADARSVTQLTESWQTFSIAMEAMGRERDTPQPRGISPELQALADQMGAGTNVLALNKAILAKEFNTMYGEIMRRIEASRNRPPVRGPQR